MKRTAKYGTGWLGGIDTPEQAKRVVDGIKLALQDTGRTIDADHYGASFLYRFGSMEDSIVAKTAAGLTARTKGEADRYLVAGDAAAVLQRIQEFIDAGCEKFVLLPMANGTKDMMEQTRLLTAEVLPEYAD